MTNSVMENITKDNYTLLQLLPKHWKEYKSIRLEALKTNPGMFGSNYASESNYSEKDWVSLLENELRGMFALYHDKTLVGLSGVAIKKDQPTTAIFFASFIKPAHRGKGLSKMFYEARMEWVLQKKCKFITVSHRIGNTSSAAAIKRFGFKYAHTEEVNWPDGMRADEVTYSIEVNNS
ncbi:GNAT family N-acetyltransferase [Pedobacter sp.]|uniref:GNAT family N-acetyltransferase n=1 Tax=Pedobacter sp. TaxID=1411316 RepID=UPI003D7FB0A8